jgi:hypothetical protein
MVTFVISFLEAVTMKSLSVLLLLMVSLGCGGYGAGSGMKPATPTIVTLSPDNVKMGSGDFVLTVNGSTFANNSVVYWNSARVVTTYMSTGQVTASIPAADIAASGTVSVYVNNPGTGTYATGVNSNSVAFTIN